MNYLMQPIIQIENSDGKPLEGGKVYVYKLGITPPVLADTYFDFQGHLNTNPIILDSLGHCTIIAEDDTAYDVIIKNKDDELQFSIHNATVMGGSGEIVIENEPVSVIEGNGLKVEKETLLDGTIQYKVSNNAINPTDKGEANFVLGKDNYAEGDYNLVQGENNVTYGKSNTIFGYNIKHNQAPLGNDYNLINGHSHETDGMFQYNIVNGYGLRVNNDNNTSVTNNAIFCSTCNLTNAAVNDSFITGDNTTITNVEIHSGNIQGCTNSIIGKNGQKSSVSYPVVLGYNNKLIHDTDNTSGPGNNTVIGGYNEDHYGYSTILGYSNKTYNYGNYILGQDNTSNGSYTWVIGSSNNVKNAHSTHILGDYNIVDYSTQDYNSNIVTMVGYHLVNRSNNNRSNGKIVIGKHNEDNPDAFLEIAKGDDSSNPKNMLEIRHDDSIYYRYNNEMIQLKPVTSVYTNSQPFTAENSNYVTIASSSTASSDFIMKMNVADGVANLAIENHQGAARPLFVFIDGKHAITDRKVVTSETIICNLADYDLAPLKIEIYAYENGDIRPRWIYTLFNKGSYPGGSLSAMKVDIYKEQEYDGV